MFSPEIPCLSGTRPDPNCYVSVNTNSFIIDIFAPRCRVAQFIKTMCVCVAWGGGGGGGGGGGAGGAPEIF